MRALAIDTSTHRAEVALWESGACVVCERNTDPAKHAEMLLVLVGRLFEVAGWSKGAIDVVVPCLGPGSFTGVRVGLATAKGIALGLSRPIVGVSGLEAMTVALGAQAPAVASAADAIVAFLDARKGEVFWAAYGSKGNLLGGPGHVGAASVAGTLLGLQGSTVVVGEIGEGLDLGHARLHRSPETDLPDIATLARLGVMAFERRGSDDIDGLEPVYVRPPDITLPKWK